MVAFNCFCFLHLSSDFTFKCVAKGSAYITDLLPDEVNDLPAKMLREVALVLSTLVVSRRSMSI